MDFEWFLMPLTQFCAVATVDIVNIITILSGKSRIQVSKGQPIATSLQTGAAFDAFPISVTAVQMWVIALKFVGTNKVVCQLGLGKAQKRAKA